MARVIPRHRQWLLLLGITLMLPVLIPTRKARAADPPPQVQIPAYSDLSPRFIAKGQSASVNYDVLWGTLPRLEARPTGTTVVSWLVSDVTKDGAATTLAASGLTAAFVDTGDDNSVSATMTVTASGANVGGSQYQLKVKCTLSNPAWNANAVAECVGWVTVTVVKVDSIVIVSSTAELIADGTAAPDRTDYCAAIKGSGDVILQAKLIPNVTDGNVPVVWTGGGTSVAGNKQQWKVTKTAWDKKEITATCETAYTMVVYVLGAEPGGFAGGNLATSNAHFADNSKGFPGGALLPGLMGPAAATGNFQSNCEIEFTIKPDALVTDAAANLFDTAQIKWDVSRDKKKKYWTFGTTWTLDATSSSTWESDDARDTEEDDNPWDGHGHLYGNDAPGSTNVAGVGFISKHNMREWVRVQLGPTATNGHGDRCSDYSYWHAFRGVTMGGSPPAWFNTAAPQENEVVVGNIFWGVTPAGTTIAITTTSVPNTVRNLTGYNITLASAGGTAPLTWSIEDGALPPGLSLNSSTGVISGTPGASGAYALMVKVTDPGTNPDADQQDFTITVVDDVVVSTTSLAAGTNGNDGYSQTLATTGGNGAATWSLTAGSLPAGLSLNSASGTITGTPTAAGTSTFTMKATDSTAAGAGGPANGSKQLTITIAADVAVTTASLPNGAVSTAYTQSLASSGGNGSITWVLDGGSLPPGLSLNNAGVISGSPTVDPTPPPAGVYNFTVKATDATSAGGGGAVSATKALSITVP